MSGRLTTHVLDTANGRPGANIDESLMTTASQARRLACVSMKLARFGLWISSSILQER